MARLRWGLIGAGDIARKRVAPALRDLPNCELVSVSRSRQNLAEEFAKEFGARRWYAEWRDQIDDDEIDAVYIATPVYLHAEQAIAAAEAGKHVLCEKPMALNVAQCNEMIAACQKNDVKLGVAYYRRFYPAVIRAKQLIRSGEIGDVVVAQMNAFEHFDPALDDPRRWLLDKDKNGGGPMMDFGCHRIEVAMNLFGHVKRVEALSSHSAFGREVEDTAAAVLRFESGCIATITVTHAAIEALRYRRRTLVPYSQAERQLPCHLPVILQKQGRYRGLLCIRITDGEVTVARQTVKERRKALSHRSARRVVQRSARPGSVEVERSGGVTKVVVVSTIHAIGKAVSQIVSSRHGREVRRKFMNVRRDVVPRGHSTQTGVPCNSDVRQLDVAWIHGIDLIDEVRRESRARQIPILLIRVVARDEASQRITGIQEHAG